eukprot:TRINITY_DN62_c0_g1_i9.p1 TRINITY_DN62_c0_g1~~TRINITY_DN62_c0_g1_i9.p1  ORF type:complete len:116 (-),score=13.54 TRINITY_DN62_c0_g1_i9:188-535(-)
MKIIRFNIVAQTLAGSKVFFVASVFSFPDDPDQSVVECVRRKGDSGDFRFFYVNIRNKLDNVAIKRNANTDKEKIKIDNKISEMTVTTTTTTVTTVTTSTTTTVTTTTAPTITTN